jgi:hypothetical protein
MGTQLLTTRRDKPRDEMEIETKGNECTFKPNLEKYLLYLQIRSSNSDASRLDRVNNDIYNDHSYDQFYSRLNNGRIERNLKEIVNSRYEFPKQLLVENKLQGTIKSRSIERTQGRFNNTAEQQTINNNDSDILNLDKKEAIPLLIIDVNIRPGVKKKIYVFDGDTPEGLADKFSQEHSIIF